MAYFETNHIRIAGITAALPKRRESLEDHKKAFSNFAKQSGIVEKRISYSLTALDLSCEAAEKLLNLLNWEKETVDAIIFVTCFPDYIAPNNACIMQDRLGFSTDCYCHDIAAESSGWVYGLSAASAFLQSGESRRAIVLTGVGKVTTEDGLSFGHAATATAVEFVANERNPIRFHFGTDGSSGETTTVTQYGMRNPRLISNLQSENSPLEKLCIVDAEIDYDFMSSWAINNVPNIINSFCGHYNNKITDFDRIFLQQTNLSIIRHITELLGVCSERVPVCLEKVGDTGSSSLPLSICLSLGQKKSGGHLFLCCGYSSYSWATVSFAIDEDLIVDLIEVDELIV